MFARKVALAAGALMVTGGVAATAAQAHGSPFTITAGTAAAGTFISVTKTSGTITFKDTTTGVTLTCDSSVIKGSLKVGPSSGAPVVSLNGNTVQFNDCTGPAGLKFAVTGVGTWAINISDASGGVATGSVTNIRVHVESTAGPACAFDIGAASGSFSSSSTSTVPPATVAGSYRNSGTTVSVPATDPGSVGLWNLRSGSNTYCISPSIVKQGDRASFSATWTLKADVAANNPIAIS